MFRVERTSHITGYLDTTRRLRRATGHNAIASTEAGLDHWSRAYTNNTETTANAESESGDETPSAESFTDINFDDI